MDSLSHACGSLAQVQLTGEAGSQAGSHPQGGATSWTWELHRGGPAQQPTNYTIRTGTWGGISSANYTN